MASLTPYARLVGTWVFYVAAASTAAPNLDASPSGSWTQLGNTDGDQNLQWSGALTALRDNHTTGPRKHILAEQGFNVGATIVHLTLENLAYALGMQQADVVSTTSGALTVKKLGLIRNYTPQRFAILARGGAVDSGASNVMSAYGAWPAQLWVPAGVFSSEPTLAFSKSGSPGVAFQFVAEYDDTQSAGEEFGWLMMRSA